MWVNMYYLVGDCLLSLADLPSSSLSHLDNGDILALLCGGVEDDCPGLLTLPPPGFGGSSGLGTSVLTLDALLLLPKFKSWYFFGAKILGIPIDCKKGLVLFIKNIQRLVFFNMGPSIKDVDTWGQGTGQEIVHVFYGQNYLGKILKTSWNLDKFYKIKLN